MWQNFKWGSKNHPGNAFYLLIVGGVWLAAFQNKSIISGILAATIVTVFFAVMYVCTSISVGKANKKLVDEEST